MVKNELSRKRTTNASFFSLLIGLGANVDPLEYRSFSPLHLASKAGGDRAAAFLLECGADVDARGRGEETPLHRARYR